MPLLGAIQDIQCMIQCLLYIFLLEQTFHASPLDKLPARQCFSILRSLRGYLLDAPHRPHSTRP